MTHNEPKTSKPGPIFIHSLFRAGSTYFFNVFRRSEEGYWCYQEPLHELALWAKGDRKYLQINHGSEDAHNLRHPDLDRPYFQELLEVSDACLPVLKAEFIYDAYFSEDADSAGIPYWRALIDAAKSRPIIQECRTASRIGILKRELAGDHVYLWRNPWDQWSSYRINDYFPAAQQLFVNARQHPEVIRRLREEIDFVVSEATDLADLFAHFRRYTLGAEQGYLVFYVLWCLGLQQALQYADLMVNVDRLAYDACYQSEVLSAFGEFGAGGVSFDDCRMPIGSYAESDRQFFERVETRAHELLVSTGMAQQDLDRIVELRQYFDRTRTLGASGLDSLRDAERARAVIRDLDDSLARASRAFRSVASEREATVQQMSSLRAELAVANQQVGALESEAVVLRQKVQEIGEANSRNAAPAAERNGEAARLEGIAREAIANRTQLDEQIVIAAQALQQAKDLQSTLNNEQAMLRVQLDQHRLVSSLAEERADRVAELEAALAVAQREMQSASQDCIRKDVEVEARKAEATRLRIELDAAAREASADRARFDEQMVIAAQSLQQAKGIQICLNNEQAMLRLQLEQYRHFFGQTMERAERIAGLEVALAVLQEKHAALQDRARKDAETHAEEGARMRALLDEMTLRATAGEERVRSLMVDLIAREESARAAIHQLQETLAANHENWSLAGERLQALERAEATIADLNVELQSVLAANHNHWMQTQVQANHIADLQNSVSWRITKPLRGLHQIFTGVKTGREGTGLLNNVASYAMLPRRLVRSALVNGMGYVHRRPQLRARALAVLNKQPLLRAHLRLLALSSGVIAQNASVQPLTPLQLQPSAPQNSPEIAIAKRHVPSLSPSAQRIFDALTNSIAAKNKENN